MMGNHSNNHVDFAQFVASAIAMENFRLPSLKLEPHWMFKFYCLKFQRSLRSSDGISRWLIYSQDREVNVEIAENRMAPALISAMDKDVKMYCNVYVDVVYDRMDFLCRLNTFEEPEW